MDIIINPTNKCDFNCTFCKNSELKDETLTAEDTIKLLKPYIKDMDKIIFSGGEPLMMKPEYYESIFNFLNKSKKRLIKVIFYTNLHPWLADPTIWDDIFNRENVKVITGFQFGPNRRLLDGKVYIPVIFKSVMNKFNYSYRYSPNFVSVVDTENQMNIIKTARLARELRCRCRLDKIMTLGRAKTIKYFPWYRLLILYNKIIDEKLDNYVINIDYIKDYFNNRNTECPVDRKCYHNIRVINNDKRIFSCPNLVSNKKFNKYEMIDEDECDLFAKDNEFIHIQCMGCKYYKFCNSCRSIIEEVKKFKDEENYCKQMKKIIPVLEDKLKERILYDNKSIY